jgi:hypothetical protein
VSDEEEEEEEEEDEGEVEAMVVRGRGVAQGRPKEADGGRRTQVVGTMRGGDDDSDLAEDFNSDDSGDSEVT